MNDADELAALVAGVLADLDGAGALADLLAEHGREPEAVLLRRRWKAWKTERAKNAYHWRYKHFNGDSTRYPVYEPPSELFVQLEEKMRAQCDDQFGAYIRTRFAGVRVEDVRHWYYTGATGHAVGGVNDGMVSVGCGCVFFGGPVSERRPTRVCRKCRTALQTAKPLPRESEQEATT